MRISSAGAAPCPRAGKPKTKRIHPMQISLTAVPEKNCPGFMVLTRRRRSPCLVTAALGGGKLKFNSFHLLLSESEAGSYRKTWKVGDTRECLGHARAAR